MKKFTTVGAAIFALTMIMAGLAQANDDCDPFHGNGQLPFYCFMTTLTVVPFAATTGMTEDVSDVQQADNDAQLKEDAADFVASDGQNPPSALLEEGITNVRASRPETAQMSDLEIAGGIVKMKN